MASFDGSEFNALYKNTLFKASVFDRAQSALPGKDSSFPDTFGYTRTHDGGHPSSVTCSTQTGRDGIVRQRGSSPLRID